LVNKTQLTKQNANPRQQHKKHVMIL